MKSEMFSKNISNKIYTVDDYSSFDEVSTKKDFDGITLKPGFDFIKAAHDYQLSL